MTFDSHYLLGYTVRSHRMVWLPRVLAAPFRRDRSDHLEELDMLIASAVALLALFAFVSILLSSDEGREGTDPRDHLAAWTRYGMR
ncbi:MAG TPA: hypothetical protein VKR24_06035 [Candidatus Limnocylindrales bacterium]|nr:hypothetical protein [Candidatus Limnocylindrales bacterium]